MGIGASESGSVHTHRLRRFEPCNGPTNRPRHLSAMLPPLSGPNSRPFVRSSGPFGPRAFVHVTSHAPPRRTGMSPWLLLPLPQAPSRGPRLPLPPMRRAARSLAAAAAPHATATATPSPTQPGSFPGPLPRGGGYVSVYPGAAALAPRHAIIAAPGRRPPPRHLSSALGCPPAPRPSTSWSTAPRPPHTPRPRGCGRTRTPQRTARQGSGAARRRQHHVVPGPHAEGLPRDPPHAEGHGLLHRGARCRPSGPGPTAC